MIEKLGLAMGNTPLGGTTCFHFPARYQMKRIAMNANGRGSASLAQEDAAGPGAAGTARILQAGAGRAEGDATADTLAHGSWTSVC